MVYLQKCAYQDRKLGRAQTAISGAAAVMQMLGSLEDDEIIRAVRKINNLHGVK
ncbi:MAG: hypothetical protein Q9M40_04980 [Sulfurimonas sp.]|nr:hypothetical protein [Sulfurimonas sp.]